MPSFKNMKQLEAYINKQAKETLYERKQTFVDVAKDHVESDVYDKYEPDLSNPNSYRRTGKLKESFKTNPIKNGIEITNTRSENGRDIAEIVEKGHYESQGYEHVKKGASVSYTHLTLPTMAVV